MINSCQKGKRGERDFRDFLRKHGCLEARRSQQFCGLEGDSDLIVPEMPNIHFEVKFTQVAKPYVWLEQANRDCKGNLPVVAWRRNKTPWLAIMTARDFMQLAREAGRIYDSKTS